MKPKRRKLDRKHPETVRDAVDDMNSEIRYVNQNRDRAVGEADRTGRHFDEQVEAKGEKTE